MENLGEKEISDRWATRASRVIRATGKHVVRQSSIVALVLAIATALIVVVIGTTNPVGQTGLVIIGVLVTYMLLPTEPHRLWNVSPTAISETVPPSKLVEASRRIAEAIAMQNQGPVEDIAILSYWDAALADLRHIVHNPSFLVRNLDYRVTVTPDSSLFRSYRRR
jgi:hypothetical protein